MIAALVVLLVVVMIVLAVVSDLRDRRVRGRVRGTGDMSHDLREMRRDARARRSIQYRRTNDE